MDNDADKKLLRIFVGEDDNYEGRPLYQAIMETLREEGVAGATVLRGVEGFGKSSLLHTANLLRMSSDLPLLIECVDTVQKIEGIMPVLDQMIGDGLVTTQGVEVRVYRGSEGTSDG
jgi:PII-like signaling protein